MAVGLVVELSMIVTAVVAVPAVNVLMCAGSVNIPLSYLGFCL